MAEGHCRCVTFVPTAKRGFRRPSRTPGSRSYRAGVQGGPIGTLRGGPCTTDVSTPRTRSLRQGERPTPIAMPRGPIATASTVVEIAITESYLPHLLISCSLPLDQVKVHRERAPVVRPARRAQWSLVELPTSHGRSSRHRRRSRRRSIASRCRYLVRLEPGRPHPQRRRPGFRSQRSSRRTGRMAHRNRVARPRSRRRRSPTMRGDRSAVPPVGR